MSTRDVSPPQADNKGIVKASLTTYKKKSLSAEKTGYYKKTTDIFDSKEKKALLLISEIKKRGGVFPIGFVLGILGIGLIITVTLIGLNVLAQKNKTIDFYQHEADAAGRRLIEGAMLFKEQQFTKSYERFEHANRSLNSISRQLWFVPTKTRIELIDKRLLHIKAAVTAGIQLAKTGMTASDLGHELGPVIRSGTLSSITEIIKEKQSKLKEISALLIDAQEHLNTISEESVPGDVRNIFIKAENALSGITTIVKKTLTNFTGIMEFLGDTHPHTILIVLQNASELRPTGGFIGSIALVEFNDGHLTQEKVSDIYSFDHQLSEHIDPPPEIRLINDRLYMRDANTSLDFPTSARQLASFFEKEGGPTVDTVISIDQTVIKNILAVIGPLKISELQAPMTAENFEFILSYIVESKIYGREDPKILLKSLLPAIQKMTFESQKLLEVIEVLHSAVEAKHIMAYSENPDVRALTQELGAEGKVQFIPTNTSGNTTDFFAIAHYSIGGNKTDAYMEESIVHDTYLDNDGDLINEVTIERRNTWNNAAEDHLRSVLRSFGFANITPDVLRILGKSFNIHMLRLYVPEGSTLIDAKNSSITTHFDSDIGATYFSVRFEVAPGDSNTITLRYKLPFNISTNTSLLTPIKLKKYFLHVVKHPGQENVVFKKRIFPPDGVHIISGQETNFILNRDTELQALIQ